MKVFWIENHDFNKLSQGVNEAVIAIQESGLKVIKVDYAVSYIGIKHCAYVKYL